MARRGRTANAGRAGRRPAGRQTRGESGGVPAARPARLSYRYDRDRELLPAGAQASSPWYLNESLTLAR